MKMTVIGAGAMGSLFGALLASSGRDVLLVHTHHDHVDAINAHGLGIESIGIENKVQKRRIQVAAMVGLPDDRPSDLVIVFVKSGQTRQAAGMARKCLGPQGKVLTLQNGLGNADVIAEVVGRDRVIAGTTAHGATVLGPGRIRHAGTGPTCIGMWSRKEDAGLGALQEILHQAGIDTQVEENIHDVIWRKLVINVGINAVTALTGVTNGKIIDRPPTGPLVRMAVEEACAVARAHGIALQEDMAARVFKVAEATSANRSSMGQDVDRRRPTEIDAINGAVVRLAEEKKIPVPVNEALTALVKTLEQNYSQTQAGAGEEHA